MIGSNATIFPVVIGENAKVGAGAVVTKDIKDYELVFGNPSIHKGWISEFGEKLIFNNDGIAICLGSGNKYSISNNSVKKITK